MFRHVEAAARALASVAVLTLGLPVIAAAQDGPKGTWAARHEGLGGEAMAERLESPARPVFRYRANILSLLELKPGMTAAEIGAGSGFLAAMMAERVGRDGRVIATELDDRLIAYMQARVKAEGQPNVDVRRGRSDDTALEPESFDVVAMVNTYSFLEQPETILRSTVRALKPGGLLVIVDFPRAGQGDDLEGADAEDVIDAARRAGLQPAGESGIVPGHYALRFRKP